MLENVNSGSFIFFLKSLTIGGTVNSYYKKNKKFVVEAVNLETCKVKLKEKDSSKEGNWFGEIDFVRPAFILS